MTDEDIMEDIVINLQAKGYPDYATDYAETITRIDGESDKQYEDRVGVLVAEAHQPMFGATLADEELYAQLRIDLKANGYSAAAIEYACSIPRGEITRANFERVHLDAEESAMWGGGADDEDVEEMLDHYTEVVGMQTDKSFLQSIGYHTAQKFQPYEDL